MPKLLSLVVVAFPLALGAQVRADTLSLPSAVVTATRLPGATAAGTATTTVLLGDALRAEGVTHLAEALRRVPGVSVARNSSFGSQTALFLRGGQSNYVRLLIDGVPVNDPGGVLDLGRITLDDIERIEIVRGPASVLYGSEAVTGVIQLFTRQGGDRRTSAELGGGSFGATRASLGASGRDLGVRWSLQGDHHGSDGILAYNNGYRNEGISTSLALAPTARTDLRITGRFNGSRYQYPTSSSGTVEDRDAERTEHRTLVGVDLGHRWSERLDTRVQYAANTLHPRSNDGPDHPGDTLGFYGFHAASTVSRRLFDLRNTLRVGATFVTLGGEFARDVEESWSVSYSEFGDFPDRFDVARENRAAYVQALGERGRVAYSLGGRLDDNSAFGTFRTVRAAVGVQLVPGLRVRAAAGNAFKAPSFFENFASGFTVGNRALRPELSRSAELGAEAVLGSRTLLRATGFTQRFRDLIQYTGAAPMGTPNYFNVAEANAGGLEVEATVLALAGVDVTAGYTWTDTRVVDAGFDSVASANLVAGERLIRRPSHEANLQLRRRLAGIGDLTATVHHLGARDDRDFSGFPATPVVLDAVTTFDLTAAIQLPRSRAGMTQLLLRAENVANTGYQRVAGFASPGRVLYAGLKLER